MMTKYRSAACLIAASFALCTATVFAEVSADKAKQLGQKLTPVGAIKAASEDGKVPAWDPIPIHGAKQGEYVKEPDDMKAEKPLYVVTGENMSKYKDMLSEGAKYMLNTFSDYKMKVYPSHRTVGFPDFIYKATAKNATNCKLPTIDDPKDCQLGFPFPIPTSGAQPIWNHKIKYRGGALQRANDQAIVDPDGNYSESHIVEDVQFRYANRETQHKLEPGKGHYLNYMSHLNAPPRIAGQILLVHESAGTGAVGRQAWLYSPALKRIRRAPSVCCDNPYQGTDGLEFYDQVDMFNGVMDRYTWKLVGRKQMIVPYNNFKILTSKYDNIIKPGHINTDLPRYETHRVWVVEATLAQGQRHKLAKRVFYVDEDAWDILQVDDYDGQGQLIQFQEGYLTPQYNVGYGTTSPEVIYHLDSGRYFVTAMIGESQPYDYSVSYPQGFFNSSQVAQSATH